jgi:hypothetical protein
MYLTEIRTKQVFLATFPGFNYNPLKYTGWDKEIEQIPLFGWMAYNNQSYKTIKEITGTNDIKSIFKWFDDNHATIFSDEKTNGVMDTIFNYHSFYGKFKEIKILDYSTKAGFYEFDFFE